MKTQGYILFILFVVLTISVGSLSQIKSNSYNNVLDNADHVNFGMIGGSEKEKNERNNKLLPNEFITNFTIKNGLIFVNANLNGKNGQFLLDSGLGSNLILNSEGKHIGNLQDSDIYIDGIGGESKNVETTWISSFNWMGIKFNNADINALPLSHIDENNINFAGIIGFNTFNGYQLTFDYERNILKARIKKDLELEAKENGKFLTSISFKLKKHMPVFEIEINGYKYNMGLDTGAAVNLMNTKHLKKIEKVVDDLKDAHIKGFNGRNTVKRGNIMQTNINNINYDNMAYSFDDSSLNNLNKEYGLGIDGLLGYEFLKKYITVVDFSSKEIRVYDSKVNSQDLEVRFA